MVNASSIILFASVGVAMSSAENIAAFDLFEVVLIKDSVCSSSSPIYGINCAKTIVESILYVKQYQSHV